MKRQATLWLLACCAFPGFASAATFEQCYTAYNAQQPDAPSLCRPLAEGGGMEAEKILGDMYYWGWGSAIQQDYAQAILWYKRAATRGQAEAKYNLGVMYEQGLGTTVDYSMAARWYLSSARDGHRDAQYNIANMYSKGAGMRQDDVAASHWYERAAKQGEPLAQHNIGNRYAKGLGVPQDIVQAYKWYALAERAGDKEAVVSKQVVREAMTDEQADEAEKLVQAWRPKKDWGGRN